MAMRLNSGTPGRLALWLALMVGCAGCGSGAPDPAAAPQTSQAADFASLAQARKKRAELYVGSEACADCHTVQTKEYHGHPMFRSLANAAKDDGVENFQDTEFSPLPGTSYYVERSGDKVLHHEKRVDSDGKLIYDQGVPVDYAIGSGVRGRTYLINLSGRLYASPISWYTQAHKWALSPGYGPRSHPRFERRVSDGCLSCHAGRVEQHPQDRDRYADAPFLEQSIGCERCHGPGKEHIAFRLDSKSKTSSGNARDPIINPAKLQGQQRDAVCNQCHLQGHRRVVRSGHTEFDFVPGQFLSDNWIIFLKTAGVAEGTAAAVSQVEQMYSSRCYQKSAGRLSCISCHDGHSVPQKDRTEQVFRQQCLNCHGKGEVECSEPEDKRLAANAADSCVACHMPRFPASDVHTAQTDHRVLRRPPPDLQQTADVPFHKRPLIRFVEEACDVPQSEIDRARGICLAEQVAAGGTRAQGKEGIELLLVTIKDSPQDLEARLLLGQAFAAVEQPDLAKIVWEQALEINPRDEDVLEMLATQCHEAKDISRARRYYEQLIEINPDRSQYHGRLAHVLGQLGDLKAGMAEAEKCLEMNPSLSQTHAWMVEAARRAKDPKRAAVHAELLRRFQSTQQEPEDEATPEQ